MMGPAELAQQIATIPLFSVLPKPELLRLAAALQPRQFSPGDLLLREGENDEKFYILIAGEVEVLKALDTNDERLLAVKGPGTLFGEMGLFDPEGRHTASVRAKSDVQALEMTRQDFEALLQRYPRMALAMTRQISYRLEESENLTILDLREKNAQLRMAYEDLKAAQEQLIVKERLDKELAIARQIQMSILPDQMPQMQGFDIAGLTFPARAIGGDYYDFIPLKGGRTGVMVSDVCDKGVPAALFANLVYSLMHVEAPHNLSPEKALRQVNRHLCEMNRAGMFVSLLYGVVDPSGRFDYCRAGHPHPLVLDVHMQPVDSYAPGTSGPGKGTGMPLGLFEEVILDTRSVMLPPGGMALLYSDGLSEALDAAGVEFGMERLTAGLRTMRGCTAEAVCTGLWHLVQAYGDGLPQSDDFTVVVIRRTG